MSLLAFADEERVLVDDLTAMATKLWAASKNLGVLNTDPRAVSLMLYSRLWSNYRGFLLLWKAGHSLEASIVLRSALETSICISANYVMREGFYPLLLGDLVATLKSQIKRWREDGFEGLVAGAEEHLRAVLPRAPENARAFKWQELANAGGVRELYGYHKELSMVSSHVTALSLMRGVICVDGAGEQLNRQLEELNVPMHIRQMMIAILIGAKFHAEVIEAQEQVTEIAELEQRLNAVSARWVE